MEEKSSNMIPKYFLAANSYTGFVSYFDTFFNPQDFDRIFILKGGPGTGKSSFMKRISTEFQQNECKIEEIYCSSDPHSLDGIIISKGNRRVAIIDGTAPHERDAKIPGAIEEIINLGDGWDERFLTSRRDEIVMLSNEKAVSYKTAYFYLSIAGKSHELISHFHGIEFNTIGAKIKAESILKDIMPSSSDIQTKLVSSFGRYGTYTLSTLTDIAEKVIKIGGNAISSELFLNECYNVAIGRNIGFVRFPSALDPRNTDALYFPEVGLAIIRCTDGEINANDFIKLTEIDSERMRIAEVLWSDALEEAKRWFAIASDVHFRLEKIYGEAMNFDKNNEILDKKIKQIENILEIHR